MTLNLVRIGTLSSTIRNLREIPCGSVKAAVAHSGTQSAMKHKPKRATRNTRADEGNRLIALRSSNAVGAN